MSFLESEGEEEEKEENKILEMGLRDDVERDREGLAIAVAAVLQLPTTTRMAISYVPFSTASQHFSCHDVQPLIVFSFLNHIFWLIHFLPPVLSIFINRTL